MRKKFFSISKNSFSAHVLFFYKGGGGYFVDTASSGTIVFSGTNHRSHSNDRARLLVTTKRGYSTEIPYFCTSNTNSYNMELKEHFKGKIFELISETADELGLECYAVGGYVRDIFLNRPSKDIDIVVVGSGIEIAQAFGKKLGKGAHIAVFKNFGTAQVKYRDTEVEFVGARRESYSHDSRKPIVENGTLEDDQNRRDFTINAMAVCLNKARFGELVDPFGGLDDLKERTIRTPLDPDITFSDDPLRMMRCVRFATQLNFYIEDDTFTALERNRERIKIISRERIADELNKILLSPIPSKGFVDLDRCGASGTHFPRTGGTPRSGSTQRTWT